MFKKIKDLSATDSYELEECIESLYELLPLTEDTDEVWLHNRLRHIFETILTDEAYNRLYNTDLTNASVISLDNLH